MKSILDVLKQAYKEATDIFLRGQEDEVIVGFEQHIQQSSFFACI